MARFGAFDVDGFVSRNENQATLKKTLGHINLVREFLREKGENRELWFIPQEQLDPLLASFFINVRTKDGSNYEPSSLRGMLGSLERHLQRHNYGQSVISEFPITKKALAAKQKELKSLGKGQKPKAASSLSGSDIDALYSSLQLGLHTPTSVVNTMWYNCMMHFGMRATTEHKSMTWGDVQLKRDAELNLEYVEFRERTTKTRTGANIPDIRSCPPRMYETPENRGRCPVTAFKFYEGRRPTGYSKADDPFYIQPVTNNATPGLDQQWYLRGPIGINKLNAMMKEMAKKAELPLDRNLTNTSVRKTLVQRMTDCNVPDNLQVYVTGHKRPESLNNYRQLGNVHKQQISSLLTANSARSQNQVMLPSASFACAAQAPAPSNAVALQQCSSATSSCMAEDGSTLCASQTTQRSTICRQGTSTSSYNSSSSTTAAKLPYENMFAGSHIHGNVNINFNTNYSGAKRRRVRVIESDSDSQE